MTVFTHSVLFWDTHFIQTCTRPICTKGTRPERPHSRYGHYSSLNIEISDLPPYIVSKITTFGLPSSIITHDGSSHEMCMACVVLNVRSSFRMTMVHVNRDYQGVSQFCDIEKWGLMDLCQIEGCFMSLSFGTSP